MESLIVTGSFDREQHVRVDETALIADLLSDRRGRNHVMIDVGAHFGTSASHFDKLGWSIFCFEPDPANFSKLHARYRGTPNVILEKCAVADIPARGAPFYSSQESTGLSSLVAFHESHRREGTVDVTTIAEIVETRRLDHIDFLKIDVEGLDFSVLKGIPWNHIKPDVIECEFEDQRTRPLGYSHKDVADFLVEKGYVVYVSEWHPIVRYGIAHDWCRLARYPAPLASRESWGNLLAFLEDPGPHSIWCALQRRIGKNLGPNSSDSTLIILGSGPSLKGFDFRRLKNFDSIGMNAAYRYWHGIGWYPRFYACLDRVVGLSHRDAIIELIRASERNGIELFFLRKNVVEALPPDVRDFPQVIDFDALHQQRLGGIAYETLTTGSHSALIGAYLGYKRMAMLGIDCNYVEIVAGARRADGIVLEITENSAANPNYFFSGYQAVGDKYHLPNPVPDLHVHSWRAIAPALLAHGVTVWNCSPISRVDAFYFRDFEDIEEEVLAAGERPRMLSVDRELLSLRAEHPSPEATTGNFATTNSVGLYSRLSKAVRNHSSIAFHFSRFLVWCFRTLWRQRWGLGGISLIATLFSLIVALVVPDTTISWVFAFLSVLCALLLLGGLGFSFARGMLLEAIDSKSREHAREAQERAEQFARIQSAVYFSKAMLNQSAAVKKLQPSPRIAVENDQTTGASRESGSAPVLTRNRT